jgi:hypothetical protein
MKRLTRLTLNLGNPWTVIVKNHVPMLLNKMRMISWMKFLLVSHLPLESSIHHHPLQHRRHHHHLWGSKISDLNLGYRHQSRTTGIVPLSVIRELALHCAMLMIVGFTMISTLKEEEVITNMTGGKEISAMREMTEETGVEEMIAMIGSMMMIDDQEAIIVEITQMNADGKGDHVRENDREDIHPVTEAGAVLGRDDFHLIPGIQAAEEGQGKEGRIRDGIMMTGIFGITMHCTPNVYTSSFL